MHGDDDYRGQVGVIEGVAGGRNLDLGPGGGL